MNTQWKSVGMIGYAQARKGSHMDGGDEDVHTLPTGLLSLSLFWPVSIRPKRLHLVNIITLSLLATMWTKWLIKGAYRRVSCRGGLTSWGKFFLWPQCSQNRGKCEFDGFIFNLLVNKSLFYMSGVSVVAGGLSVCTLCFSSNALLCCSAVCVFFTELCTLR
jgi:hypothetical protein